MWPRIFDPKLRRNRRRYVAQVGLASVALFSVLWAEDLLTGAVAAQAVLVAAIASTSFVLFIMPHSDTARPRHAIGGHVVALAVGVAFSSFADTELGRETVGDEAVLFALYAAVGVGLSMFLMAATNTEHPPAAGTALGVLGTTVSIDLVLFVLAGVVMLVLIHLVFKRRLINLY